MQNLKNRLKIAPNFLKFAFKANLYSNKLTPKQQ